MAHLLTRKAPLGMADPAIRAPLGLTMPGRRGYALARPGVWAGNCEAAMDSDEITEEMVEAGAQVLIGREHSDSESTRRLVREVLEAALGEME